MKFEARITLGNVLTIVGGLVVAGGGAFAAGQWTQGIDSRLARIEMQLTDVRCSLFVANVVQVIDTPCYAHGPVSTYSIDGAHAAVKK